MVRVKNVSGVTARRRAEEALEALPPRDREELGLFIAGRTPGQVVKDWLEDHGIPRRFYRYYGPEKESKDEECECQETVRG